MKTPELRGAARPRDLNDSHGSRNEKKKLILLEEKKKIFVLGSICRTFEDELYNSRFNARVFNIVMN
uniref:SFRICE_034285 n=1 Tax=Spodoptera frugiperda TaxID=7108 RepID=A0A2H1W8I5_SPOFR